VEHLDFLNKNTLRNYPAKGTSSLVDDTGTTISDSLISDATVTTTSSHSRISVAKVYATSGYISVAFVDYSSKAYLGSAYGPVSSDFTTIKISPANGINLSGSITTGFLSSTVQFNGIYVFSNSDAFELEESVIRVIAPPVVSSIKVGNETAVGSVSLGTLFNVTSSKSGSDVLFKVTSTSNIESVNDFDSSFRNCPTPVVTSINGAVPYGGSGVAKGGVYLIGVNPIIFTSDEHSNSIITSTSGVTMTSLCTAKGYVLPPTDPSYLVNRPFETPAFSGAYHYYSKSQTPILNMFSATAPEYLSWPQFLSSIGLTLVSVSPGSRYQVFAPNTFIDSQQVSKILVVTSEGSVTCALGQTTTGPYYDYMLTGISGTANASVVVIPSDHNTYDNTKQLFIEVDSISGTPTLSVIVWYKDVNID
jgi:hypothetical protein